MSKKELERSLRRRLAEREDIRHKIDILDYQYNNGLIDGRKYADEKARLAEYAGETMGMAIAFKMWR